MKNLIVVCLCASLFYSLAMADGGILIGGGMTFSNYSVSDNLKSATDLGSGQKVDIAYKFLPGGKINWNYWYKFNDRIGVITGANFETRGSKIEATFNGITASGDSRLHYFTVPIYASYTIIPEILPGLVKDFSISLGPEIGIIARMGNEASSDAVKIIDYGASLNCSVSIVNIFSIGAGYQLGLSNFTKTTDDTFMKNNAIKVFFNYIHKARV